MTRMTGVAFVLLCGSVAAAAAQERDVARQAYTFLDRTLKIQVVSEVPGALRVLRGEPGRLEVAARTPEGFPAFALGGRAENELRLTSMGGGRVDYVVVVPEQVRVRIMLPDRKELEIASTRPAATYQWGAERPAAPQRSGSLSQDNSGVTEPPTVDGMYLSHYDRAVPRVLSLPEVAAITKLEVRFEGSDFRLSTSRPVSVQPGRSDEIVFRTGSEPIAVTVGLPRDARDFRLLLGGKTALEVVGGEVRSYCDQVIDQKLSDGRRYFTYHPSVAKVICR